MLLLEKNGVRFGEDDLQRLNRQIKTCISPAGSGSLLAPSFSSSPSEKAEAKISMEAFCNLAGIFVHEDATKRVVPHTRVEPRIEEGVFQSSRLSLLAQPNYATTFALESTNYTPGSLKFFSSLYLLLFFCRFFPFSFAPLINFSPLINYLIDQLMN